jgi:L-asparaginase
MTKVLLLSLGGTIAMTGGDSGGVKPRLESHELLDGTGNVGIQVTARDLTTIPGAHLQMSDLFRTAEVIGRAADEGFGGVVVTQGTDTIEETAYALDLLVRRCLTTVVTGAIRPASAAGADGPANLTDAISVAAVPEYRELGVMVVFGGEIHAARFTRKAHTQSPAAFASYPGPLGWVVEGQPEVLVAPRSRRELMMVPSLPERLPQVALLTASLGDDASLIDTLASSPYDGIVVEAFGAGHVPATYVAGLGRLARTRPIILASRVGQGPLFRKTYAFPGSERDLLDHGLISAGDLDGPKARVALVLLLASGRSPEEIRAFYAA